MYGYIIGKITKINPKYIICENNGIGYLMIVSNPYNYKLNEVYKIYTHQYVREDILDLYGFQTEDEKELFLKLISVSGIGPKSALSILASGTVNEIINAIESRNDAYLRKFPGIGTKASQQIILDLRGKLSFANEDLPSDNSTKLEDVESALLALGYNKKEVSKVIAKLDTSQEVGVLVKEALKQMVR
ncbi:MAG: Holliday junction branch migration protein RuvA [Anaeroplasma sp.]